MSQQHELDEALAKIREEQASDEVVKTAAGRVFRKLFDSAFITAEPTGKIRGCEDVRALIPAYLNRALSGPRSLLLEDHILTCVDCRRALQEARTGTAAVRPIPINRPRKSSQIPMLVWAAAAALMVGIGLGVTGHLPGQNRLEATVAGVQGTLYRVTDTVVSVVKVGQILNNTDELRTAQGSHAMLRLAGGAMVEIGERSDVAVSNASLTLERGQMIVDTHTQLKKAIYVNNGDMTVPVLNGVVAFDHGTKDSNVAVAKGQVDVQQSGHAHQSVRAGNIYGGELRKVSLPIASEFSWSQNANSYLPLLQQFSALQKDLQNIPSPELRYSTQLAQYLPADTFLYAAIPNAGGTITEAKKLFDSRLAESAVLRQWWEQQAVSKNGEFDRIINQISAIGDFLGDEIVISVGGSVKGAEAGPVFLAQLKKSGLAEYLQTQLPANSPVQIVTGNAATAGHSNRLLIDLDNNVLVVSPSATRLQLVEEILQQRAASGFTGTPFFERVAKVYTNGAGSFLAANLEQIVSKSVMNTKVGIPTGFENIQYLVLERKQSGGGDTEMRAAVSFDGSRQGVASWLAAPGPAGSLNFVSPTANFAASMVMKSPRVMMRELLDVAGARDQAFAKSLAEFEAHTGVHLLNDVAAPLGNDLTFAIDGPILSMPWKLIIEVNDPGRLQTSLQTFVTSFNARSSAQMGQLQLTPEQVSGRTFYSLTSSKANGLAAYYTFVDGYLVASSSEANIITAIQNKQAGQTLAASDSFRAKLPADGYTNFSAMVFSNFGKAFADLTQQLNTSGNNHLFSGVLATSGPGLICVYGDTDRIAAAAKGSFLGFDLGTLVNIQQGKPLQTIIADAPPIGGKAKKGIVN